MGVAKYNISHMACLCAVFSRFVASVKKDVWLNAGRLCCCNETDCYTALVLLSSLLTTSG